MKTLNEKRIAELNQIYVGNQVADENKEKEEKSETLKKEKEMFMPDWKINRRKKN